MDEKHILSKIEDDDEYFCFICDHLLYEPVEFTCCGKLLCRSHAENLADCPICQKPTTSQKTTRVKNKILSLRAKCYHEGCEIIETIGDLMRSHIANCQYRPIYCKDCDIHITMSQWVKHYDSECERKVLCCHRNWSGCGAMVTVKYRDVHEENLESHIDMAKGHVEKIQAMYDKELCEMGRSYGKLQEELHKQTMESKLKDDAISQLASQCASKANSINEMNKIVRTLETTIDKLNMDNSDKDKQIYTLLHARDTSNSKTEASKEEFARMCLNDNINYDTYIKTIYHTFDPFNDNNPNGGTYESGYD